MDSSALTAIYAISAALVWGSGDFASGLASRRIGALHALLASYALGLLGLTVLAFATGEPLSSPADLGWGVLAGIFGMFGFLLMLQGFNVGRIGVVSAVSSLLASAVPVVVAIFSLGLPGLLQLAGFGLAFISIWLVSSRDENDQGPSGLSHAILGGLGFGIFFTIMGQISDSATFWPLAASRLVACTLMAGFVQFTRQPLVPKGAPGRILLVAGLMDVFGNFFFLRAVQSGRLDIAAVLVSLYPGVTVLLARFIAKEHMTRLQSFGVLVALVAIVLITA